MVKPTTRKMSSRHEDDLVALLGGERTRNSGAVWSDQADGHQTGSDAYWRFGWDGKSTLGKSIGITRKMLAKLREQCRGLEPMLPLRWYADERLTRVDEDWIAIEAETLAQIIEDANRWRLVSEVGCMEGNHEFERLESGSVPGMMIRNGPCRGCGQSPHSASRIAEDD